MKKIYPSVVFYRFKLLKKIYLIMKLAMFLIILSLFQVTAKNSFSQDALVNLNIKNAKISDVLSEIEKQTSYLFFYNRKEIDVDRMVASVTSGAKVSEVLTGIFLGTNVDYKMVSHHIVLTRREQVNQIADLINASNPNQVKISGVVTDASNGDPLPGVSIVIEGTSKGTITNMDGQFSLDVAPENTALLFSFIGYTKQRVLISGQNVLNIKLVPEAKSIDEVVVIGYGVVRKSDLTGSVTSVKSSDLTKITSANVEQSLQGKVAGVQVASTSGAPGSSPMVRVRGVGTFNNSSPIFVVDGVILEDISFLNSGDIASLEVLKDASATAIYGSRGSNGVIIITTKMGKIGDEKVTFNYSGEYSLQKLAKKIDLLSGRDFALITNEINTGTYSNIDAVPNTDWQDLVFHVAPIQNHQFSVSGATKIAQYYVGFGYFKQEGIIDKSNFERFTFKLNNTYNFTKHFKFGNNITIAPYKQQNAPDATYAVYRAQPLLKPYYEDGSYAPVLNVGNPLAALEYSNDYRKGIRGVGNVFLESSFLNSFVFRSSLGVDASYNKSVSFTPAYTIYNADGTASQQQNVLSNLYKGNSDNLTWLWENTLNYSKTINKNSINALAGYTMQNSTSEYFGIPGENVLRDGKSFWYINPAYLMDPSNNVNTVNGISNGVDANQFYSMMSYLFRANYTYDGKYIATATYRRDGSSKFSKANRFSNFPSFALGWNISKEDFIAHIPLISNLKIRGSWGVIGNEKINYSNRYSLINSNLFSIFGKSDGVNSGATYDKSGNPDLKWESTTQTDIGLEVGFFKDRLTGEFDFYNRVTDDILVELSTPGYLGNGTGQKITFNAGSILNRGFEYNIKWKDKIGALDYSVTFLGSTVHNEVLKVGGNTGIDSVLIDGRLGNGIPVTLSRVGIPTGSFYGYKTDGIFQTQAELDAYPHSSQAGVGDLRFVDVNGDGVLNGSDRTNLGSPIPKFTYGFNIELFYKNFDFSLDIQGQTGNKIFNGKEVVRPDPYNFEQHVMNRWTGAGTSNSEPRPSFGGYNYTPSDRFVQDGSFTRLRNITIGYSLPTSLSSKFAIQKLRLFMKGSNIYTLTKYTGYSPEIGGGVLSSGIDTGIYPITAVYSFGVNLTF